MQNRYKYKTKIVLKLFKLINVSSKCDVSNYLEILKYQVAQKIMAILEHTRDQCYFMIKLPVKVRYLLFFNVITFRHI